MSYTKQTWQTGDTITAEKLNHIEDGIDDLSRQLSDKAPVIINTASGDIASFADGADGMQIRKIVGTIVPVQSGTGDPSPDNVRPISGWTGANIEQRGKNLYNIAAYSGESRNGITITNNGDGTLTVNGTCTVRSFYYLPINQNKYNDNVVLSGSPATGSGVNTYAIQLNSSTLDTGSGIPINANTTINTIAIRIETGAVCNNVVFKPMIRVASVGNSDFEPYAGATLPINWQTEAGTIYGGTVTLNEDGSADVVVSRKFATYDGDEEWQWRTYNNSYYARIYAPDIRRPAGKSLYAILCNCAKGGNSGTTEYFAVAATWQDFYIYFFNPTTYLEGVTDLETFKAYIAEHPIQVVYPLATPQTYHFSNIGSLLTYYGQNNIWIDTGAITECDYPADTKLYIDGKLAELQATILENIGG